MTHGHRDESTCIFSSIVSIVFFQFYDPGMKEINRLKVMLPERDEPLNFPTIELQLTIDGETNSSWRIRRVKDGQKQLLEKVLNFLNVYDIPLSLHQILRHY